MMGHALGIGAGVMVVIVLFVLTVNLLLHRPVIESLLFAVALAVVLALGAPNITTLADMPPNPVSMSTTRALRVVSRSALPLGCRLELPSVCLSQSLLL